MDELKERIWKDEFGSHFEVSGKDSKGRIHSRKITRTAWSPSWDDVRRDVRQSMGRP